MRGKLKDFCWYSRASIHLESDQITASARNVTRCYKCYQSRTNSNPTGWLVGLTRCNEDAIHFKGGGGGRVGVNVLLKGLRTLLLLTRCTFLFVKVKRACSGLIK